MQLGLKVWTFVLLLLSVASSGLSGERLRPRTAELLRVCRSVRCRVACLASMKRSLPLASLKLLQLGILVVWPGKTIRPGTFRTTELDWSLSTREGNRASSIIMIPSPWIAISYPGS